MIKIKRIISSNNGTYGVFIKDNQPLCVTLELPWKDNKTGISCIPVGEYNCVKYTSEKYKNVWKLLNVKDRNDILIHTGNYITDIKGCILVGLSFGDNMICHSKSALDKLRLILPNNFILKIEE